MKVTRSLHILGRVQGVMFRESMREQAERLGLTGWVRNRRDGSLEALVQGEASAVEAMIAWAHHGPELAVVERVEIADASGEYGDFARLPTKSDGKKRSKAHQSTGRHCNNGFRCALRKAPLQHSQICCCRGITFDRSPRGALVATQWSVGSGLGLEENGTRCERDQRMKRSGGNGNAEAQGVRV